MVRGSGCLVLYGGSDTARYSQKDSARFAEIKFVVQIVDEPEVTLRQMLALLSVLGGRWGCDAEAFAVVGFAGPAQILTDFFPNRHETVRLLMSSSFMCSHGSMEA